MELSTPADLLALIPTLMNREPEEILVLITIKDNQMQAALGMEHLRDEENIAEYVSAIITQMLELKPEALVMVFYTETESGCDHEPYEHVNILTMLALDALTPMTVNPGVLVKGGRYHVYGSGQWHDIEEVKDSQLAASLVLNGIPLQPEGLVIPEPTALTEEVTEAIDERVARIPEYPRRIEDAWHMPYVTEERALYESLLQRGFGATEPEAVRLIACFQNPMLRDRLMVDTISSTMDPMEFGDAITGQSDIQPNPERVMAAASLIANLMQWTCDRHRLPLLVAQAWMSWMQGRTLDAEQYLDVAVGVDPDYRMAKAFHRYIRDLKRLPDGIAHGEGQ
jgi:hypothetical protein